MLGGCRNLGLWVGGVVWCGLEVVFWGWVLGEFGIFGWGSGDGWGLDFMFSLGWVFGTGLRFRAEVGCWGSGWGLLLGFGVAVVFGFWMSSGGVGCG